MTVEHERLRVLIVDDEPLALDLLRTLLAQIPDVDVVGEASNGDEALMALSEQQPDLVILDIEMPGRSGLQTGYDLARMSREERPAIIFVTAHPDHAVDAFDLEATDYVLKPVRLHRLRQAVERVRQAHCPARLSAEAQTETPLPQPTAHAAFWVPTLGGRRIKVEQSEILRIEAARDHVLLFTQERSFLLRSSMEKLASQITDPQLVRVHRSAFVRLDQVKGIVHRARSWALELRDGTQVPVSPRHRQVVARITE